MPEVSDNTFFWFISIGTGVFVGTCFGWVLCSLARAAKDNNDEIETPTGTWRFVSRGEPDPPKPIWVDKSRVHTIRGNEFEISDSEKQP
jgi:hypothetical protein